MSLNDTIETIFSLFTSRTERHINKDLGVLVIRRRRVEKKYSSQFGFFSFDACMYDCI